MAISDGSILTAADLNLLPRAFASTAARDAYYVANPAQLVAGVGAVIGSGATYSEYLYTGTKWLLWTGSPAGFAYASGFSDHISGGWAGLELTVRSGMARINGAFAASSWAAGATVLTLSADYRPARQQSQYNCQVNTSGALTVSVSGSSALAISATWPLTLS